MSKIGNGKPLRFAALIRVSTERQERKGESLRTQNSQIEQAVDSLGGKIVVKYAGQEHATAGWEREQLGKLLADAAKPRPPFDAVIVADATRWSRDNVASDTGLETLRDAELRFFVLGTEYDLFNPEARFFLRMTATVGAYHAHNQNKKSIENRIARARRGIPTCGKKPFGRVWDDDKQQWNIIATKQAMIRDCAARYLAGESLPKLAKEYGVNHANLCKVLRDRCGDQWSIGFRADDLNINETVPLTIPPLLSDRTIRAVRQRLEANRTYLHKPPQPKHDYLLSGRVFCAACGYCLMGQWNHSGKRYYRHPHVERVRDCPLKEPRPWVRADVIESAVLVDVFNTFGDPARLERALKAAIPDSERLIKQRDQINAELAKVDRARNRLLNLIGMDAITDSQAKSKLFELRDRRSELQCKLDKLADALANAPDADQVRLYVERSHGSILVYDDEGNQHLGGNNLSTFLMMTAAERRELIRVAFDGVLPDGKPAGVYITPAGGNRYGPKHFTYMLRGQLLGGSERVMPRAYPCKGRTPRGRRYDGPRRPLSA